MSYLVGTLFGVVFGTWALGFYNCSRFELRLRKVLQQERVPNLSGQRTKVLYVVFGVIVLPLVIGIAFLRYPTIEKQWTVELKMVLAALKTRMQEDRISWHNAIRVHQAYARRYLPTEVDTV